MPITSLCQVLRQGQRWHYRRCHWCENVSSPSDGTSPRFSFLSQGQYVVLRLGINRKPCRIAFVEASSLPGRVLRPLQNLILASRTLPFRNVMKQSCSDNLFCLLYFGVPMSFQYINIRGSSHREVRVIQVKIFENVKDSFKKEEHEATSETV